MQKFTYLLLLVMSSFITSAQEIRWMTMNEALQAQKKEPKKIFMDAYTTWCGPCKMLDRNTFSNADVASYINKNFYPVKFNAEGTEEISYRGHVFSNPDFNPERRGRNSTHEFARAMRITGYPSLAFFDASGTLVGLVPGYRDPHQIEIILKLFVGDDHKNIKDPEAFSAYSEAFNHEFRVSQSSQ